MKDNLNFFLLKYSILAPAFHRMNAYIDIDIDIYTLCLESDVCHLITESFRRNSSGDREKALQVMLQVLQSCDHPAPDMFCLCGRIYKDIFLDSDCKDDASRDSAIEW